MWYIMHFFFAQAVGLKFHLVMFFLKKAQKKFVNKVPFLLLQQVAHVPSWEGGLSLFGLLRLVSFSR